MRTGAPTGKWGLRVTDWVKDAPVVDDDDAVAVGFERWRERAAEREDAAAITVGEHSDVRGLLAGVFCHSPYLTNLMLRDQEATVRLLRDGPDAAFASSLDMVTSVDWQNTELSAVMETLRKAKRQAAVAIAFADIGGAWPLEKITGALTRLADEAVGCAWRFALHEQIRAGRLPGANTTPGSEAADDPLTGSGLICLAMGKMGARELNYSSDIDLVVFYDDENPAYAEMLELQKVFVRATKRMVQILEERTRDGYVFRTDLRLRPDAAATPVAVSLSAAEVYYESLGQNWERAALIKARPVGCDFEAADGFLARLRPFIWRKHLDFASIRDIHSIKRQIATHKGGHDIKVLGHDVKLGRGGIREIEFFAQTQQLIWGGRDARLRVRPTKAALDALIEAGRITQPVADDLMACYRLLRRIEHRLQMIGDVQTHTIPEDPDAFGRLARFLGYEDPETLGAEIVACLETVTAHYAELFEDDAPLTIQAGPVPGNLVFTGVEDDPATLETIAGLGFETPAAVAARIRAWHHGRYRATRSERARQILTEITPALLAAFGRGSAADDAFRRFDLFLERLPAGVQIFSLFHANPKLLDALAEIFGMAPSLALQLGLMPSLLEGMLTHDLDAALPDGDVLEEELARDLERARVYEDALDYARRWINDRRFQVGVQALRGVVDAERAGRNLSDIADIAIRQLLPRAAREFAQRHGRIAEAEEDGVAVVALGKLGGRELTAGSDLDLLFLYDVPITAESDGGKSLSAGPYFVRLGQRLLAALTAKTAEGGLFDVDMRLRPTGNKGPLAVSLDRFMRYHADDAWTWERMALTRARVVAGPPALAERVERAIRDILSTPRDPDLLLRDVASMRDRMGKEHRILSPWSIKHWRGGLVDIEFIAQYLLLRHSAESPDLMTGNTVTALRSLAQAGHLEAEAAEDLAQAATVFRNLQAVLRLTVSEPFEPDAASDALKLRLAAACGAVDFEALEKDISALRTRVREHWDRLIANPAAALADKTDTSGEED